MKKLLYILVLLFTTTVVAQTKPVANATVYYKKGNKIAVSGGGSMTAQQISDSLDVQYPSGWKTRTAEELQDAVGAMFNHANHTNVTVTYNDTTGQVEITVTGGGVIVDDGFASQSTTNAGSANNDYLLNNRVSNLEASPDLQFDTKTANYTLVASDATTYNRIVKMNMSNAGTVTIPASVFTHGQSIIVQNQSDSTLTVVAGSGVDFPSNITLTKNRSITIAKDSISGNAERFVPLGGGWNLSATTQTQDTLDALGRYPKELTSGNWDMDATASINIAHGLNANEWRSITDLSAIIKNDDSTSYKQIDAPVSFTDTNIVLDRVTSGTFDGTDYDATGFDRATVTFMYKPTDGGSPPPSGTQLYTESSAIVLPSAGTETATLGSWIASSGTIDINTTLVDTGTRSFERSPSFDGNNGYFYLRSADATNGETYTVSFRYYLDLTSASGVNVFVEGFDSSQSNTSLTTEDSWQTFTVTGTGTTSQFADVEITFTGTTVEADRIIIDSFSIIQHD